jgi:hypothetical protein
MAEHKDRIRAPRTSHKHTLTGRLSQQRTDICMQSGLAHLRIQNSRSFRPIMGVFRVRHKTSLIGYTFE